MKLLYLYSPGSCLSATSRFELAPRMFTHTVPEGLVPYEQEWSSVLHVIQEKYHEQYGQDNHHPVRDPAAQQLQDGVADEADADPRGDRVRERHKQHRQDCWDADGELVCKVHLLPLGEDLRHVGTEHQEADQDERGGSGLGRHNRGKRAEPHQCEEAEASHHRG